MVQLMKALTITALGLTLLSASGCAVMSASVNAGSERTMARSINDKNAQRAIMARMSRASEFDLDAIRVEVAEGIVVLAGHAPTQQDKVEAERIAWSAPHVVKVGNEIRLQQQETDTRNDDSYISANVRRRLTTDTVVKGRNINIETYQGKVYLLGVARTSAELERATYLASQTQGVDEVISYIKLADMPVEGSPVNYRAATPQALPQSSYSSPPTALPQTRQAPHAPTPYVPPSTGSAQNEPYYVDPKTGERITLPPGTVTVPYDPNRDWGDDGGAPYYIDPDTGKKVLVVYRTPY